MTKATPVQVHKKKTNFQRFKIPVESNHDESYFLRTKVSTRRRRTQSASLEWLSENDRCHFLSWIKINITIKENWIQSNRCCPITIWGCERCIWNISRSTKTPEPELCCCFIPRKIQRVHWSRFWGLTIELHRPHQHWFQQGNFISWLTSLMAACILSL